MPTAEEIKFIKSHLKSAQQCLDFNADDPPGYEIHALRGALEMLLDWARHMTPIVMGLAEGDDE
jgi:hypothetical protein